MDLATKSFCWALKLDFFFFLSHDGNKLHAVFEVSKLLFVIMNHQRKKMTKCRSASLSLNVTHKCSNLPDNHDYSLFFFLFESGDKIIKVKFSDNHLGSTVWC